MTINLFLISVVCVAFLYAIFTAGYTDKPGLPRKED